MSGARRAILCGILGAGGLALYLWPALAAPVVVNSDSEIDLKWAREGVGMISPAMPTPPAHPAKPGWIAFLRGVTAGADPDEAPRRIVFVQCVLLWISIAGTCLVLARTTSFARGVVLYVALICFLRLPDAATTIMSEALTAALFLPVAAALLDPPARLGAAWALGGAGGALFLVRPNAGGIAAVLALVAFAATRRWRALGAFAAAAVLLVVPIWILTSPPDGGLLRGLGPAFGWAKAEYGWVHSSGPSPADASEASRQMIWRLFHGPFGLEFHDATWSRAWWRLDEASRLVSPILVLAALACLIAPGRGRPALARPLGLTLAALLVAQGYALGALPRFALPFLPGLFLFAVVAWPPVRSVAAATFVALLAAARWQRHVLDREWGRIEGPGARIVQTIPRGALPTDPPATVRIRITSPMIPSSAALAVRGPDDSILYDSRAEPGDRRRPYVEVPLPAELLAENRRRSVTLTLVSGDGYGDTQYLLYPVIPPPWGSPAVREGSEMLSPSTGVRSGALDWWVRREDPP